MKRISVYRILSAAMVAVCFAFLLPLTITAQDADTTAEPIAAMTDEAEAPTELPTEAPTETPAPTSEPLPTAIPTDIPTEVIETPIIEPTAEATVEPTDDFVPSTPIVVTDEPTATLPPEPALRLLAAETFDSGDLSRWRRGAGWSLVAVEGGQSLELRETSGAIQFAEGSFRDVAVQARFQLTTGTAQLLVRQTSEGVYSASLSPDGRVELARSGVVLAVNSVAPSQPGWRVLRLSAMDGLLRVAVDGMEVIALEDESPLPAGAVSLAGLLPATESALRVDDVEIWLAESEPLPTSTDIPTEVVPTSIIETVIPVTPVLPPVDPVTAVPTHDGRVIVTPEVITYESTPAVETTPVVESTAETTPAVETTPVVESTAETTPAVEITPAVESTTEPQVIAAAVAASLTMTAPVNGAYVNTTTPTFTWTAAAAPAGTSVTHYQIQFASNSTFTTERLTFAVRNAATTYTPRTALPEGVRYWRLRACFSDSTRSAWSAGWSFTIDTIPPGVPSLIAPSTQSTDTTPTFSWNAAAGAARYELLLGTVNPPTTVIRTTTARNYTLPTPLLYGVYFWRVRAIDLAGNTSESPIRRLTLNSAENAAPVPHRFTTPTVTLSWTPLSWATAYHVQVAKHSTFANKVYNVNNLSSQSFSTTTGQLENGTYYWRVRARRADGTWGGWSATGIFTVEASR